MSQYSGKVNQTSPNQPSQNTKETHLDHKPKHHQNIPGSNAATESPDQRSQTSLGGHRHGQRVALLEDETPGTSKRSGDWVRFVGVLGLWGCRVAWGCDYFSWQTLYVSSTSVQWHVALRVYYRRSTVVWVLQVGEICPVNLKVLSAATTEQNMFPNNLGQNWIKEVSPKGKQQTASTRQIKSKT